MTDSLRAELGRQRIAELRALATQTDPGSVLMPDHVRLRVTSGWEVPYVLLTAAELLAMLDRLDGDETVDTVDT